MDQRSQVTAARVLNTRSVDELTRIFREFGEEKQARRIANAVVRRRETQPWARTGEFAELIEATVGRTPRGKLPSPARCFQALRIYLNNELEELEKALESVISHLSPGGRLVVISFHSLEDRIVKKRFLFEACECVCPPDFPVCRCEKVSRLRVLTRRPITATGDELDLNPRARSAKLRAAEKLTQD
jgi:16S rRNA (cytosine1402-N4)-methyltransferase